MKSDPSKTFLKFSAFKAVLQEVADATRQETVLFNDNGVARMTLQGWPMRGAAMGKASPR